MIKFYTYCLPFKAAFKTASDSFKHREGILIEATFDEQVVLCEASPLPGFSKESFSDVARTLLQYQDQVDSFLKTDFTVKGLNQFLKKIPQLPSLQFSLSYLGLQILAGRKSCSLNDLFNISTPQSVFANEIIGSSSVDNIVPDIEAGVKQGFQTFKCKARYPLQRLVEALKIAIRTYPDIIIRFDANQSWPEHELESINTLCRELPLQYIEEPVPLKEKHGIEKVKSVLTTPIAADESINDIETLDELLRHHPDLFIIIKPMLLGNLIDLFETIYSHRSTFKKVVVTTSLESVIGRKMILSSAFLLGDPTFAHGLNTGKLFTTDLTHYQPKLNASTYKSGDQEPLQLHDIKTSLIKPLR